MLTVNVIADGDEQEIQLPVDSNVQEAMEQAGIVLEYLDRVEPSPYSLLADGQEIRIVRVREEFSVEQEVIPFEREVLQTESLPAGEKMISQSGMNGLREITNRHVIEDGIEVSKFPVRETVVTEAIPEIIMVGIQAPFVPVSIPGRIVYLLGSNAWMMDQSTGNRKPVVTTGDLDGHVFALSEDGSRLLFTRRSKQEDQINTLWVADLNVEPVELYDLKVANVVQFAGWVPDPKNDKVAFSTVEPRPTAPGWQANNDLNVINYSSTGWVSRWKVYVDANSGGVYGWWGTDFMFGATSDQVVYARPDSFGLVNMEDGSLQPLKDIIPLQTGGDWAWVPGLSWSPEFNSLIYVEHVSPPGSTQVEESLNFDLSTLQLNGGINLPMVSQTGMFAYPAASPMQMLPSGENSYQIAYLQAVFPSQSETSKYRLMVMDRDGSNQNSIFPAEGKQGLVPQQVVWSPTPLPGKESHWIAVVYDGNLWLIDSWGQEPAQQITGDGLVSKLDWK